MLIWRSRRRRRSRRPKRAGAHLIYVPALNYRRGEAVIAGQKNAAAAQEADRQRQERMQRAQADADKLLKNARGAAEQERNAMLEGAKKDIAQMVVSATGKLMDKENDPAFDKALYDSFLKAAQEENDHD